MIAAATLLMALIEDAAPATIVLTLAWGAGFGAVPVATQTWTAQTMPANIDGGLALFTSALQGSLAAGSAVGGLLYDAHGASAPLILAAVVAAGASLAVIRPVAGVDAPPLQHDPPDPTGSHRDSVNFATSAYTPSPLRSTDHGPFERSPGCQDFLTGRCDTRHVRRPARVPPQGGPGACRKLIDKHPGFDPGVWRAQLPKMDAFGALLFQIVGQQLSVRSAHAILDRLERPCSVAGYPSRSRSLTPIARYSAA